MERQAARELAGELDGLPLALEQAAAYVAAMHVTYGQYLESYRTRKLGLLERLGRRPGPIRRRWPRHGSSTSSKWRPRPKPPRTCCGSSAMLDPNEIPFELLTKGAKELGQPLCEAINPSDPLSVNEVLEPLARFSLVGIDAEGRTYSIHRLVQEVVKDAMGDEGRRRLGRTRGQGNQRRVSVDRGEQLASLSSACSAGDARFQMIGEFTIRSEEAGRLLNQAAFYLHGRGQAGVAEPLYRRLWKFASRYSGNVARTWPPVSITWQ